MQKQKGLFFSTRNLVFMALLIAMQVVLARFLSIRIGDAIRISFSFVPVAYAGLTMGIGPAAFIGAVADIIGALLFPSGAYFPGFTLTALVGGVLYGAFFHKRNVTIVTVLLCKLAVDVICNLCLNTIWLTMIQGKAFTVLLPARALKNLLQYPVDVALLFALVKSVQRLPLSLKPSMKS